jgi:signal recognition particle receptor subunit beta
MIINYTLKTASTKIACAGIEGSGKESFIKALHDALGKEEKILYTREKKVRISEINFDGHEWKINARLVVIDDLALEELESIADIDGILLVIDATEDIANDTVDFWNRLSSLSPDRVEKIPVVACLNKKDSKNSISDDRCRELFDARKKNMDIVPCTTTLGTGVKESFLKVMKFIFQILPDSARDLSIH